MADVPKCADLARRAVACPRWRWMPGMLVWWRLDAEDEPMALRLHGWPDDYPTNPDDYEPIYPGHLDAAHDAGAFGFPRDAGIVPDLSDPATLGCLLALVREALEPRGGSDYIASTMHTGSGWGVRARFGSEGLVTIVECTHDTEAEALVAALERAP